MLKIYTDGSCKKSGEDGGYSFVILNNDELIYEQSGKEKTTTSQSMEIKAINEALIWCGENLKRSKISLYTDSNYGKKGCSSWIKGWAKSGWVNSRGVEVSHVENWKSIYENINYHEYTFKHVKAHNGDKWNEYCDEMAKKAWKNG